MTSSSVMNSTADITREPVAHSDARRVSTNNSSVSFRCVLRDSPIVESEAMKSLPCRHIVMSESAIGAHWSCCRYRYAVDNVFCIVSRTVVTIGINVNARAVVLS